MPGRPTERQIVFCVGAVQFVNILDFMIVMPLGPDFATALGIPVSELGWVGGAYTAAACISGVAGAFFLDRFDRRKALAVALLGLFVGTLSGAFARGLASLMTARLVAGAFGGPATSLSYSIIADRIPAERRGKAMGAVMGAFAVASVLGVPAGLELARIGGWRAPFVAVAVCGAVLGTYAQAVLPPMFGHVALARGRPLGRDLVELARGPVMLSLTMSFLTMASGFVLIPNISAYVQYNLGYPRDRLGLLYLIGGLVSFFTMRGVGRLVDRFGSARIGVVGTILGSLVTYLGFVRFPPAMPVLAVFVVYMTASSFRSVSVNTLTTKVPRPNERASFGSMQSAVQHLASSAGAFSSSLLLAELPDHELAGMPTIGWCSIALGLALPFMLAVVEGRVRPGAQPAGSR